MSQSVTDTSAAPPEEVVLSRVALKALGELPGMLCGNLSPLARLRAPAEPAGRDALIAALEGMRGPWQWAMPALIAPGLSVAMLVGDGETSLLGQYLWPDAEALGPGFKAYVDGTDLRLAGPVTLERVQQGLLDFLALGGVDEMEPLRLLFPTEQFWALTALADAYRAAILRRRLAREGGRPLGVTGREVVSAWETGLGSPNPGWSVSLFSMLVADRVPRDFQARIPQVLTSMVRADLLERLSDEGSDPLAETYMFGEGIALLCQGLSTPTVNFGLAVQRQREDRIETTVLGGWRTRGGIAVADLSQMDAGRVDVLLAGPHFVVRLVEATLEPPVVDEPRPAFTMETRFGPEALLAGLRALPAAPARPAAPAPAAATPTGPGAAPGSACASCGANLAPGARFCPVCGKPAQPAAPPAAPVGACPKCGARNAAGARFCRECGGPLEG